MGGKSEIIVASSFWKRRWPHYILRSLATAIFSAPYAALKRNTRQDQSEYSSTAAAAAAQCHIDFSASVLCKVNQWSPEKYLCLSENVQIPIYAAIFVWMGEGG